jgi:hypothetical protein
MKKKLDLPPKETLLGVMNSNIKVRLSQRHDPEIINELQAVSDESGISQVALIAACIKGLYKTWTSEGELTFPFVIVPERIHRELQAAHPPHHS